MNNPSTPRDDGVVGGGVWEGLGGPISMDRPNFDQRSLDPTLDDCCRRELQSGQRRTALESTLRRHDVVALAERRRRHLITTPDNISICRCCYDPHRDGGEYPALTELRQERAAAAAAAAERNNLDQESDNQNDNSNNNYKDDEPEEQLLENKKYQAEEDDDDDDLDEYDYLLDDDIAADDNGVKEWEESVRAQVEMRSLYWEMARQHGYGMLQQIHPLRVLAVAGLGVAAAASSRHLPPAVVLHLFDPNRRACASLDLLLEALAGYNTTTTADATTMARGTKFLRSEGRATALQNAKLIESSFPQRTIRPDDLPMLVAIRDGCVINVCQRLQGLLMNEGNDDDEQVVPEAVFEWLDRSGVLLSQPPSVDHLCGIRPEEEALLDVMMMERNHNNNNKGKPVLLVQEEEIYNCGVANCHKTFRHEHVGVPTAQQDGLVVSKEEIMGNADNDSNMDSIIYKSSV